MEQKQPIGLLFDSIAYYTQNSEEDIIIYSSDGDLTQLVKKNVKLYNPSHQKL